MRSAGEDYCCHGGELLSEGKRREETWRIVDRDEADVERRWISEDSPLGRPLLGHCAGDEVHVDDGQGRRPVIILLVHEGL